MTVEAVKAVFGPADFIINKGQENEIRFNGKDHLQNEGGEITLEPQFQPITSVDMGGGDYDDRFTHFTGTVIISGFEDSLKNFELALGGLQEIVDGGGEVKGYSDAPVGASNRERAVSIDIAPRGLMNDETHDEHIHIYKAASTATYNRAYGNEQGAIAIELKIYPKDGADFGSGDNFFRRGHASIMPWYEADGSTGE